MLKSIATEWWHRARFLLSRMRSKPVDTSVAEPLVAVYRFDGRLVLEGCPPFRTGPWLGAVGSTGAAVLVPRDADDAELADHVLRLLDECGAAVPTVAPSDGAVATALGLHTSTVGDHLHAALDRLHLRHRAEAVRWITGQS